MIKIHHNLNPKTVQSRQTLHALLCFVLFFLTMTPSFAQNNLTITGTVRDQTGEGVPGATILVKGTSTGTRL